MKPPTHPTKPCHFLSIPVEQEVTASIQDFYTSEERERESDVVSCKARMWTCAKIQVQIYCYHFLLRLRSTN